MYTDQKENGAGCLASTLCILMLIGALMRLAFFALEMNDTEEYKTFEDKAPIVYVALYSRNHIKMF